jgi:hypothetical protein
MTKEQIEELSKKVYMGDAVYASFDGFHVVLTTSNGITDTNTIAIEPAVWNAIGEYHLNLIEKLKKFGAIE